MPSVENNPIDYSNIKFTRDTKVDYKTGNTVYNSVFKVWDTDGNGEFNDAEWNNYQNTQTKLEQLKQSANTSVVSHYDKQIEKLNKRLEILNTRFQSIAMNDYYAEFTKFANEKGVQITCVDDNSSSPEGALELDISLFEIGDGKETIYEKGYVEGLDKLSDEDRQKFMDLYNKSVAMFTDLNKVENDFQKLLEEINKNAALCEMAEQGFITSVGDSEYENQAYESYQKIRTPENPFFSELQRYEQMYNELANKQRSSEENVRLESLGRQIEQLKQASLNWLGSNSQNIPSKGQGFQITDLSSNGVASISSEQSTISNTNSVGVRWDNVNWGLSAGYTQTDNYTLGENHMTTHDYSVVMEQDYRRGSLTIGNSANYSWSDNNQNFSDNLRIQYRNFSFSAGEEISTTKFEMPDDNGEMIEESQTSYNTSFNLSHQLGNFTNTAGVRFAEEGTTYSLGTSADFGLFSNERVNVNLSPSVDNQYNTENDSYTMNVGTGLSFNGNWNNFRTSVRMNENYSRTMQSGVAPDESNMFSVNSSVGYKNFNANLSFSDMDSQFSHSDTYGASISYNAPKVGTFTAGYSYMHSNSKMDGESSGNHTFNLTYTAPLDSINRLFKRK